MCSFRWSYYGIRSQYSVIIEVLKIYRTILKNIFFLFHISVYMVPNTCSILWLQVVVKLWIILITITEGPPTQKINFRVHHSLVKCSFVAVWITMQDFWQGIKWSCNIRRWQDGNPRGGEPWARFVDDVKRDTIACAEGVTGNLKKRSTLMNMPCL